MRVIGLFVRHEFGSVYKVVPALFGYEWIQMLQSQMTYADVCILVTVRPIGVLSDITFLMLQTRGDDVVL